MTADPPASKRVCRQQEDDSAEGALLAGPPEVAHPGERMRPSAAPALKAFARVSDERSVQISAYQDYAMARAGAHRLQHLYELNGVLVDLSLAGFNGPIAAAKAAHRPADYASATTQLFQEIAAAQPSLDLAGRIEELGDRLLAARRCELKIFPAAAEAHAALCVLWDRGDINALRHLLRAHHEARAARAEAIARALNERADAASRRETLDP